MGAEPDTNSLPDPSSSLRPPRGEILPTFWEQYGAWVILGAACLVAIIALIIWLKTRPKPAVPVPWSVQARQELAPLRNQPEDGVVLSRVSQILRHHIARAFGLPSQEMTTSEFCRALLASEQLGAQLAGELSDLLKECDIRKFALTPPSGPSRAAERAWKFIDRAEMRLVDLAAAAKDANAASGSFGEAKSAQPKSATGASAAVSR